MKITPFLFFLVLMCPFFSYTDRKEMLARLCNESTADPYEKSLKPENEQFIRSVADQMGITESFKIKSYPTDARKAMGPHSSLDTVYVSDEWFDEWADSPNTLRFVIGHELAHIDHSHVLKSLGYNIGGYLAALYANYRTLRFFSDHYKAMSDTANNKVEKYVPFFAGRMAKAGTALFSACCVGTVFSAIWLAKNKLLSAVSQAQEYEADQSAYKKLGPHFGEDAIALGAGTFFSKADNFEPANWFTKCFASHPHSRDRLRALNIPHQLCKEAGDKVMRLIKKRCILYVSDLLRGYESDDYAENWKQLLVAARLCSVDESVADSVSFQLLVNEAVSLPQLISGIKKRSLDDSTLKEEFAHDDLNRLEQLMRTTDLYKEDESDYLDKVSTKLQQEITGLRKLVNGEEF